MLGWRFRTFALRGPEESRSPTRSSARGPTTSSSLPISPTSTPCGWRRSAGDSWIGSQPKCGSWFFNPRGTGLFDRPRNTSSPLRRIPDAASGSFSCSRSRGLEIRVPSTGASGSDGWPVACGSGRMGPHVDGEGRHRGAPVHSRTDTRRPSCERSQFLRGTTWLWCPTPSSRQCSSLISSARPRAAELGDRRWRELLDEHYRLAHRELARFRGIEIDSAGDGFFFHLDGPARAIACARAILDTTSELELEVRAGIHTGVCEVIGEKLAGIAFSVGSRIRRRGVSRGSSGVEHRHRPGAGSVSRSRAAASAS